VAEVATHGRHKYQRDGCRCEVCRRDNADYARQHRRGVCGTPTNPVPAEARRVAMQRTSFSDCPPEPWEW
jgi:hypothetical protein